MSDKITVLEMKYGCNPNQKNARLFMGLDAKKSGDLPIKVLNGQAGYINLLDALNGWQLVSELKEATKLPAATSFKHVSPAGAALGTPLSEVERQMYHIPKDLKTLSPLASAYAKARGADRMSSFGDFISLSDKCDVDTAMLIKSEVSDGIIAPSYDEKALEILKAKKGGKYTIIEIDPSYVPEITEKKQVFGITFEQDRNNYKVDETTFNNIVTQNKTLTKEAVNDLTLALITLKYTQSNSVCYAKNGQTIGVGAGQQSRIHCTRLAGDKADIWHLRSHEKVLNLPFLPNIGRAVMDNTIDVYISKYCEDVLDDGKWQALFSEQPEKLTEEEKLTFLSKVTNVALGSDAFFPFSDNIDRAKRSGVKYIVQPGGSIRDEDVIKACDSYDMVMAFTGMRLFHH